MGELLDLKVQGEFSFRMSSLAERGQKEELQADCGRVVSLAKATVKDMCLLALQLYEMKEKGAWEHVINPKTGLGFYNYTFADFCEYAFTFSKTKTSDLLRISQFVNSYGENRGEIEAGYQQYNTSQLIELASVPPSYRAYFNSDMSVKKMQVAKDYIKNSGEFFEEKKKVGFDLLTKAQEWKENGKASEPVKPDAMDGQMSLFPEENEETDDDGAGVVNPTSDLAELGEEVEEVVADEIEREYIPERDEYDEQDEAQEDMRGEMETIEQEAEASLPAEEMKPYAYHNPSQAPYVDLSNRAKIREFLNGFQNWGVANSPYTFMKGYYHPFKNGMGIYAILFPGCSDMEKMQRDHFTVRYYLKRTDGSTNVYKGSEFVELLGEIPNGYRVDNITGGVSGISVENSRDYNATRVVLNAETYGNHIYPITVNYTDKWFVTVNWMQPYKDTPFAVKTSTDAEIRVLDYPDIYALTKEDVAKILGRKDMTVMGLVQANKPNVHFDGVARYTVDVTYGTASLKQIDYDGNVNELKIPLTSYVDWCDSFGADWTILFLNTKEKTYFQYSNDVAREDLYGFFATAVFEEQVSDLNYWFRNNTGDGQMTIFSSKSVEGSSLYKFFDNMTTKGIVQKAIGTLGMMLCETIDDSNKIYHNYYFYLDGNSKNAYLSNGGADDAFDNDSALENKGEDIVDGVKDSWDKVTDKGKSLWQRFRDSKWDTVVVVVLCVVGGLIVVGLGWKWGKRFYVWVTAKPKSKTTKKKKSASKKK